MKRILNLILLILLIVPISVKADMGAPEIEPYEAVVNKVEGINYYTNDYDSNLEKSVLKKEGVLEYETKIKIQYEEKINGEIYGMFWNEDESNSSSYLVKLQDVILLNDSYVINEDNNEDYTYKLDKERVATVLKDDGIIMRKGPASAYSSVGEVIPKGTKLTITHSSGVWYYTEYNGVKGWICELYGEIGFYTKENLFVAKDLDITSNDSSWFGENERPLKIKGTIPANTLIKEFYVIDGWSWGYYVTYNGISGYIDKESVCYDVDISEDSKEMITKTEKTLYTSADKTSEILIDKIPPNTKIKYKCGIGHNVYSWIYIEYNNKIGWIEYDPEDFYDEFLEEEIPTTTTTTTTQKVIIVDETKSGMAPLEIIILCIFAAIIIALTHFVLIIFINKKKKKVEKVEDKIIQELNNDEDNSNIE